MRYRVAAVVAAVAGLGLVGCSHVGQDVAASAPEPGSVSAAGSFDPERDCSSGEATAEQVASYCNGNGAGQVFTVGDTVRWDDGLGNTGTVTLNQVTRAGVGEDPGYPVDPPPGGTWLLVQATVEVTAGEMPVSELLFAAWNDAGVQYQPGPSCAGVDQQGQPPFPNATLVAGRNATGVVCFNAPAGPLLLDFDGMFSSAPLTTFQITS